MENLYLKIKDKRGNEFVATTDFLGLYLANPDNQRIEIYEILDGDNSRLLIEMLCTNSAWHVKAHYIPANIMAEMKKSSGHGKPFFIEGFAPNG